MCGIAGIVHLREKEPEKNPDYTAVLDLLRSRGPDYQGFKIYPKATLYHARLSIVDTSPASNQPFVNADGTRALVFNGEIFNYRQLAENIADLRTNGDVEVLLRLLEMEGQKCFNALNGFFAFAFYNESDNSMLVARDRLGVKPLYYFYDENVFAFASELKPLMKLIGKQKLNYEQLYTYFRLNYCSGKETIFKNVYRLLPGQCIDLKNGTVKVDTWYKAPHTENKQNLFDLLDDAVKVRLNADVPVGAFLSGGLDSSIISALAKKHKPDLNTFSIGFEHERYFDETRYSEMVAKHINSKHHVYKLKEDDFLNEVDNFLDCIDEPFADSSAFNFYLLSKYTRKEVKVALSGDGADELFKGYNKHKALMLSKKAGTKLIAKTLAAFTFSASSRDGFMKNKNRQLEKFKKLTELNEHEQQKFLASISNNDECSKLIKQKFSTSYFDELFKVSATFEGFKFEDVFDIQTVLSDDMLVKADRFSMQQSLEIRNPFLDYRVLEFALNLNNRQKISSRGQKLVLRENFRQLLPDQIFARSKKGFELPLQKWLTNNLREKLENEWLNKHKIENEGYLNDAEIEKIKTNLFSENAGDSAARMWAIIVFEAWLNNFKEFIHA